VADGAAEVADGAAADNDAPDDRYNCDGPMQQHRACMPHLKRSPVEFSLLMQSKTFACGLTVRLQRANPMGL
jgi:hypothetical protein